MTLISRYLCDKTLITKLATIHRNDYPNVVISWNKKQHNTKQNVNVDAGVTLAVSIFIQCVCSPADSGGCDSASPSGSAANLPKDSSFSCQIINVSVI